MHTKAELTEFLNKIADEKRLEENVHGNPLANLKFNVIRGGQFQPLGMNPVHFAEHLPREANSFVAEIVAGEEAERSTAYMTNTGGPPTQTACPRT